MCACVRACVIANNAPYDEVHGETSDEIIAAHNSLAVAYERRGMHEEAKSVLRRRMALIGRGRDKRLTGPEPPVGHLAEWYYTVR